VVYITRRRDAILSFDMSISRGSVERRGVSNAAHPQVSPDGGYIAYSALDSRSERRVFIHDRRNPAFHYDPVSQPDHLTGRINGRDGENDDHPTWSLGGNFIAYRTRLREDEGREAIFVTRPHAEPEPVVQIARLVAGQHLTCLRWHWMGEVLLAVVDGDVYSIPVPERFWDRG
jgi:hypothetical protein